VLRRTALIGLTVFLAACAGQPRSSTGRPAAVVWIEPDADPGVVRARFVADATAMLGQPYRWGGAAPGGFDCSGLVVYAAAAAGIRLPRTAAEQLQMGTAVSRRELRAGDLVFMHLKRKELHVGIAIDGERFVNAPAGGGHVRIDSLASPAYARGFLQARRILD
jgi:cell wall-associated NlpC family hydrolase